MRRRGCESDDGGQVAQSVEQRTENPCVECSIHSLPTIKPNADSGFSDSRFSHDSTATGLCSKCARSLLDRVPAHSRTSTARRSAKRSLLNCARYTSVACSIVPNGPPARRRRDLRLLPKTKENGARVVERRCSPRACRVCLGFCGALRGGGAREGGGGYGRDRGRMGS
jgi:hypothetical protein